MERPNDVRRWMHWASGRASSRWPKAKQGRGSRLILSIGLIAGGAFASYRYFPINRMIRDDEIIDDMPCEVGGHLGLGHVAPGASCKKGNGDDVKEREHSKRLGLEIAIKKSRELLQRAKDELGAPGMAVAVSVNGKLVWTEGIGYADIENRTPCGPNSVFRIASISKSLAMTAVARLMEEGKLDLDKPVQEYVPTFPEKEWDGEKVAVSTRHLVSHLSGIRHYDKSYMKKNNNKKKADEKDAEKNQKEQSKLTGKELTPKQPMDKKKRTKDEPKTAESGTVPTNLQIDEMKSKREFKTVASALEMFKDDPLMHKPGSKYSYTTHGYTLISAVIEGASGTDFLAYMKTMLRDMDLRETVPDKHIPIIYNRARGYFYNKKGKLVNCPYVDLSYKWAGGGYLSTVGDLIKFGNIMLYSYQYTPNDTDKSVLPGFLKKETMETIWKPVDIARSKPTDEFCYAMGWEVFEKEQQYGQCRPMRHFVAHSGGAMGFTSILTIAPSHVRNDDPHSEIEKNNKRDSKSASHIPKGVVVALFVNLLDAGVSKPAHDIAEMFQLYAGGQD